MTNQEELMLAAAVVGIAALVIFSQPSMEKIRNQPPESDTKQESETRHKAQAENMKLILRTKTEMRLWAAKGQSFLQKTGPAPEGEDKTDHEWIELTSLIGRAKQLFAKLGGELDEFNRTFRTSYEEIQDAGEEQPALFRDVLEQLETRATAWGDHFLSLARKARKASPKPDYPLGADVTAPKGNLLEAPPNEDSQREFNAKDTKMVDSLPGEPDPVQPPTNAVDGFNAPGGKSMADAMDTVFFLSNFFCLKRCF